MYGDYLFYLLLSQILKARPPGYCFCWLRDALHSWRHPCVHCCTFLTILPHFSWHPSNIICLFTAYIAYIAYIACMRWGQERIKIKRETYWVFTKEDSVSNLALLDGLLAQQHTYWFYFGKFGPKIFAYCCSFQHCFLTVWWCTVFI